MLWGTIAKLFKGGPALTVDAVWMNSMTGTLPRILAIRVFNNERKSISIAEVGFLLPDNKKLIFPPGLQGTVILPRLLEQGASITIPLTIDAEKIPPLRSARCAYAKTVSGDTVTGSKSGMREIVDQLP